MQQYYNRFFWILELFEKMCIRDSYNIINSRILGGKPTIINTNLTLSELRDRYTERIVSRLMGTYSVLTFYGNDIRQLKRQ